MKKVKVMFVAVVEDETEDTSKLYGAKEQVDILEKLLHNGLVGSKNLKARIRYASREVSAFSRAYGPVVGISSS